MILKADKDRNAKEQRAERFVCFDHFKLEHLNVLVGAPRTLGYKCCSENPRCGNTLECKFPENTAEITPEPVIHQQSDMH
jgi:hypothetical protein